MTSKHLNQRTYTWWTSDAGFQGVHGEIWRWKSNEEEESLRVMV